jgi:hypothetical protein
MAGNLKGRLSRLEAKVRESRGGTRECGRDVFADIERYTARLEFFQRTGHWPPDMTHRERRQFEADIMWIMEPSAT